MEHGGLRLSQFFAAPRYSWHADACENGTVISLLRQSCLSVANKVNAAEKERLEMPVRMKLPVLPVYYYHDHFTEMLFFVGETYGPVLTERHRAFVETFKTLPKDAHAF
jgi:hypothetical protein